MLDRRPAPTAGIAPPPTLAVLTRPRNERAGLPDCLTALERQTDPPEEGYIVDDGSTDGSSVWLDERYALTYHGGLGRSAAHPWLRVWRKKHSGKARSLNEVWPKTESEVLVTIDADTVLEPNATAAIRRAFAAETALVAACGILEPKCRRSWSSRYFELFQTFEYIRAFLARVAWMESEALLLVSGAFAAYRKDAVQAIGGYDPESLVEDYDLIHRLYRHSFDRGLSWKVRVIATARARTDAPAGVRAFLKQRQRWFSGFLQTQFKNGDMVGNPRYGNVGTLMLPIKAADTLQPIYGLVAFALLVQLVVSRRSVPGFILAIIGMKLILDLVFHFWSVKLYHRWRGERVKRSTWLLAALATVTEPISFQLLRHTGALLGWIGFLRGANDWAPQRESADATAVGGRP